MKPLQYEISVRQVAPTPARREGPVPSRRCTWCWRAFAGFVASSVAVGAVSAGGAGAGAAFAEPVAQVPAAETAATAAATGGENDKAKVAPADTLSARDAELLAEAQAQGERDVTVIIATDSGGAASVQAGVERLGGTVARRFDRVGYVLARVPTAKVVGAAKLPGVAAIDLDEVIHRPDPTPTAEPRAAADPRTAAPRTAGAGPGPDTPAANPFLPTHEIGAVAFRRAHPTWDGRGVTIGIMDSGVDLDHPALRQTSTDERKILDWVTATDPALDGDGTWRPMTTPANGGNLTTGGRLTTDDGVTYQLPPGVYLFNRFSEDVTKGSDPAGDVNRDGDTTDRFGILYDPVSHDIRVDANLTFDFTDDPVMRPYRERFDIGHFGADNPATPVLDRMPFVVEYREDVEVSDPELPGVTRADFVNIGIVENAHGTHVAGIAAAHDMFGNPAFDGVAPGARIVSSRACSWGGGCTVAALTTGMVDLVENRKVQVVNLSVGGLPPLNDGGNARAALYNRLITDHGVQMVISAGNEGPGVNTVGDPAVATNAVAVAASVSRRSWLANYGSVVRKPNNLFTFSSRGPREDGGAKPDVAAPGSAISTTPMFAPGNPVPEAGYPLPPGYSMFNGTSMAAPQVTGGAALLLSAARANDQGVTPAQLRRAFVTSARPIAGVPTYAQGNGMVNVPGAWRLLAEPVPTRKYTSQARVCTPISAALATPHRGPGIHNRCGAGAGGHRPGQAKRYTVELTRHTGPERGIRHTLTWLGNDGTFAAPPSVLLPRGRTVSVTVVARPAAGAHSAILRVDDPATPVVDFEVFHTVVAAADPAEPAYAFAARGAVDRNSAVSYFVNVPEGADALQVNLSGVAAGSQTRFVAFDPNGLPADSAAGNACYTGYSDPAVCAPDERSFYDPTPGVWEIAVESRRTSAMLSNPFEIRARVQGTTVSPAVVESANIPANEPAPVTWTVRNEFGPVAVTGRGGPLGSAFVDRPTIADGDTRTFTVEVPPGAARLEVAVGDPGDLSADLDLTVFLGDIEVGRSADGDAEESVSLTDPKPGRYRIEVRAFAVPAGEMTFDYRDVYYSATLGTLDVPERATALAGGGVTTVSGTVTATVDPPAGRRLFGELTVVTEEGALIGRGAANIDAIMPPPPRTPSAASSRSPAPSR